MPKIFELLGYPISDNTPSVKASRQKAFCPFIGSTCDGGGNREMSELDLKNHPQLAAFFEPLAKVPAGVCSVQLTPGDKPWIICPRRLLYMGSQASQSILRGATQQQLIQKCSFNVPARIGVWAETQIKFKDLNSEFNYRFDYLLAPLGRSTIAKIAELTGLTVRRAKNLLENSGYTLGYDAQIGEYADDFFSGPPVVVEVMTSSTSGGNKKNRSCIPQAFEDAILGKSETAPGINYRQVWARMASQLIVKSQAANAWGGKAIWVLQDTLADYISRSTALDLGRFLASETSEVNILAYSYPSKLSQKRPGETIDLNHSSLYAGLIKPKGSKKPSSSFQDIVLASVCPPVSVLLEALCKKRYGNILHLT